MGASPTGTGSLRNTGSRSVVVSDVFTALADPTRRMLLDALAGEPGLGASALARQLPVSRQAIARHLGILEAAGLIRSSRKGRELCFTVDPGALLATARWMERAADRWLSADTSPTQD